MASQLGNLAILFDLLDRHDEAHAARAEAVGVYRELAARDPELYGADYQRTSGALRREYDARGLHDKAIALDLPGSPAAPPAGDMGGGESAESVTDKTS